jgi:nifR3 family TIM-barrel protein
LFKAVKIGSVTVPHGIFLAPMAGITDCGHRMLAARCGAEYAVSEMISAAALCYGDKKTGALARVCSGEAPTAIQLFGHDPAMLGEAADIILSRSYFGAGEDAVTPPAIDINMGCPVKKIVSSGDGSALMRSPELCARIVEAVKRSCDKYGVAVTVKIRSGWSAEEINAPSVALAVSQAGAASVTVHGRTKAQMYAPYADLTVIGRVRDALPENVPVIGNGDIRCAADAKRMIEETGCDGVMIGREAMGNPWVFTAIARAAGGMDAAEADAVSRPTDEERIAAAMHILRCTCYRMGEESGVKACRGRVSHFIKGMRGAAEMRLAVTRAETAAQVREALTARR